MGFPLTLLAIAMTVTVSNSVAVPDKEASIAAIRQLNQEYIDAARMGDAEWFDNHMADDVLVVLGSGRRMEKPEFMTLFNEPSPFSELSVRDVNVRVFGPIAQVDADAPWQLKDGSQGVSRYIDTYAWLDGRWQVISAQITLLPADQPTAAGTDSEAQAILKRIREACEAYETGDVGYLEGFLHMDYTLTNTRGITTNREQDLAEVARADPNYEEFRNHDMNVRVYGNTAVVKGITSLKGVSAGKPFELEVRFTDTLIKHDGTWQLLASHASPIE